MSSSSCPSPDSFSSFRAAFPEWCEEATTTNAAHPAKTAPPSEQLMGLRYVTIRHTVQPTKNVFDISFYYSISEVIILICSGFYEIPLFCHLFTSDLHGASFYNVFPRWLLHRLLLFFCFGSHELDFYCHYRRSLRISTPLSDSACSSSAESSDCESSTSHIQVAGAPVEILPGLFLGNATHSKDARALQKYNIQVSN